MTERECTAVAVKAHELFPDRWIREEGRIAGAWRRQRTLSIVGLFWTLVLGFGAGKRRTLQSLHRQLVEHSGYSLAYSSFVERFTLGLVRLMRKAVEVACAQMVPQRGALAGFLAELEDLLLLDSTIVRLHRLLRRRWCSTQAEEGAAAKLHMVYSVKRASPARVRLDSERCPDIGPWRRLGTWVGGRLLIFDQGYYCHSLFASIAEHEGYFLTRFKNQVNPLIVGENRRWRGRSRKLVGKKLHQVLGSLQRQVLDVEVQLEFKRRAYRGRKHRDRATFRLVGIYNEEECCYHLYLTNIRSQDLGAAEIAELYRLRWQVELLFRELKTHLRLNQLGSSKAEVVEALLWASIVALLLSRKLLDAARRTLEAGRRIGVQAWAAVFGQICPQLLAALVPCKPQGCNSTEPLARLASLAVDPHRHRSSIARTLCTPAIVAFQPD